MKRHRHARTRVASTRFEPMRREDRMLSIRFMFKLDVPMRGELSSSSLEFDDLDLVLESIQDVCFDHGSDVMDTCKMDFSCKSC